MMAPALPVFWLSQAPPIDLPWQELAGGGAALLIAAILVYVLRHVDRSHDKCSSAIEKVAGDFAATVKSTSERFAEATTTITREMRESHERREDALHQLIRENRNK